MKTLSVDLGERSYPIHIGTGLLARAELITPHIRGRQVMIVTNETIAPLYLEAVQRLLVGYELATVVLPNLSEAHYREGSERFNETLRWAIQLSLLIAVPATFGLFLLAQPILATLFEYGAFSLLAFFVASWFAVKRKYDIFHAHNMPDTLVFCGLIHRLRGARIILDLHDLVPEVYIAKYDLKPDSWIVKVLCGVEAFCVGCADLAITTRGDVRRRRVSAPDARHRLQRLARGQPAGPRGCRREPRPGCSDDAQQYRAAASLGLGRRRSR